MSEFLTALAGLDSSRESIASSFDCPVIFEFINIIGCCSKSLLICSDIESLKYSKNLEPFAADLASVNATLKELIASMTLDSASLLIGGLV